MDDWKERDIFLRRFWKKVLIIDNDECWEWLAHKHPTGYAGFVWRDWNGCKRNTAHTFSYSAFNGRYDRTLSIDHICRNRGCVNPNHLRAVTIGENVLCGTGITAVNAKKTHCINGHEFTNENTKIRIRDGRKKRECRKCLNEAWKRGNAKKRRLSTWASSDF